MTDKTREAILGAMRGPDGPTSREVFEQAVRDQLDGTPHANHPVQFEMFPGIMVRCTLCHAAVPADFQDDHRQWHNAHVRIHEEIVETALRRRR